MPQPDRPPLIGITCCTQTEEFEGATPANFKVGDKYVEAIAETAAAIPVLIPGLGPAAAEVERRGAEEVRVAGVLEHPDDAEELAGQRDDHHATHVHRVDERTEDQLAADGEQRDGRHHPGGLRCGEAARQAQACDHASAHHPAGRACARQ